MHESSQREVLLVCSAVDTHCVLFPSQRQNKMMDTGTNVKPEDATKIEGEIPDSTDSSYCSSMPTENAGDVPADVKTEISEQLSIKVSLVDTTSGPNVCGICAVPPIVDTAAGDVLEKLSPHGYSVAKTIDPDTFWIMCDVCNMWFHGKCAEVDEYEDDLIDKFHCKSCSKEHGPTQLHQVVAPHRIKYYSKEEAHLPIEVGTKTWIDAFRKREADIPAPSADHVSIHADGNDFAAHFDQNDNWKKIFLVKNKDGLNLMLPENDFTFENIVKIFGSDYLVDTIDVYRQVTVSMPVGTFYKKMQSTERPRLYNFLSLEFTKNEAMRDLVAPPLVVYHLSFVHKLWPDSRDLINWGPEMDYMTETSSATDELSVKEEHKKNRPDVALFCLCGMAGSYTDWHIDFGGSSVWYHIYKGQKIFYVAEPTDENLKIYEDYQVLKDRTETWLGDLLTPGSVKRVVISEGETLMIPSGWIHAVYTPCDSLVFGGNFLHMLNVPMQMRIYGIENRLRDSNLLDEKFLFPQFELVNWYAARSYLLAAIRTACEEHTLMPPYLLRATEAMIEGLSKFNERDAKQEAVDRALISTQNEILAKLSKYYAAQLKLLPSHKRQKRKKQQRRSGGDRYCDDGDEDDGEYESYKPSPTKSLRVKLSLRKEDNSSQGSSLDGDDTVRSPVSTQSPPASRDDSQANQVALENDLYFDSPMETFSVRLTRKGDKYASEVLEKPSAMVDDVRLGAMFARRSKSGRVPRPANWVLNAAGDDIQKEVKRLEEEGDQQSAPELFVMDKEMEEINAREERELLDEERRGRKRTKAKPAVTELAAPAVVPPKKAKPATTAKQRLAKRLNLR